MTTVVRQVARGLVASGVAIAVGLGTVSAGAASRSSAGHRHRRAIDDLAPYEPQRTCDPRPKPGVVAFRAMVLRTHPSTFDDGIGRACNVGGPSEHSEHKEGRAWDWGVRDRAVAEQFLRSLLARDRASHKKYGQVRRFGIMYIIYNKRIWSSSAAKRGWQPYPCSGVTLCHEDHVHFSFSWEGARKQTSGWGATPVHYRHRSGARS